MGGHLSGRTRPGVGNPCCSSGCRRRRARSAWFSREDHELGTFDVGKKADLVVLNQDYLTVSDDQLRKTRSLLTLLGGRVVHAAGAFSDLA